MYICLPVGSDWDCEDDLSGITALKSKPYSPLATTYCTWPRWIGTLDLCSAFRKPCFSSCWRRSRQEERRRPHWRIRSKGEEEEKAEGIDDLLETLAKP